MTVVPSRLVRFEHNGSVDYKMQDCNEETYPFGEVFDIVVSGSDDAEGFRLNCWMRW